MPINIHVDVNQRDTILRAVALQDTSLTDFVTNAVLAAAYDVVLDQATFTLNSPDFDTFVESLANENPKLRELLMRDPRWKSVLGENNETK